MNAASPIVDTRSRIFKTATAFCEENRTFHPRRIVGPLHKDFPDTWRRYSQEEMNFNSIFYGDKLLTTDNPMTNHDLALFNRLGLYSGGSSYAA